MSLLELGIYQTPPLYIRNDARGRCPTEPGGLSAGARLMITHWVILLGKF